MEENVRIVFNKAEYHICRCVEPIEDYYCKKLIDSINKLIFH